MTAHRTHIKTKKMYKAINLLNLKTMQDHSTVLQSEIDKNMVE